MAFDCKDGYACRGSTARSGPHATVQAKLFEGHNASEMTGSGRSPVTDEWAGGFAQAGAPTLQAYQGGSYEAMMKRTSPFTTSRRGEPRLQDCGPGYRGIHGIDIFRVLETGILPSWTSGSRRRRRADSSGPGQCADQFPIRPRSSMRSGIVASTTCGCNVFLACHLAEQIRRPFGTCARARPEGANRGPDALSPAARNPR